MVSHVLFNYCVVMWYILITQVHGDYDIVSGSKRAQCTEMTFRALNVTKKRLLAAALLLFLLFLYKSLLLLLLLLLLMMMMMMMMMGSKKSPNRTVPERTPKLQTWVFNSSSNLRGPLGFGPPSIFDGWEVVPLMFQKSHFSPTRLHEVIEHAHRVQNSRIAWKGWILGGSVDSCDIHGTTMNNCNLRGTIVSIL